MEQRSSSRERREVHCRKSPPRAAAPSDPRRHSIASRVHNGQYWPQFLPDGRHFLFYQNSVNPEHKGIYVASLDSAEITLVVASAGAGLYASGYLLLVRDGVLFAQAFDDRALQTRGEAVQIADRVGYFSATLGYMAVTVSQAGVLAYGPNVAMTTSLQWRDRDGTEAGSAIAPAVYRSPRLSSDQKRVVVTKWHPETGQSDMQVIELALRNEQRQTFELLTDWFPVWFPDGSGMFFGSSRTNTTTRIFRKTGSGPDELFGGSEDDNRLAQVPQRHVERRQVPHLHRVIAARLRSRRRIALW